MKKIIKRFLLILAVLFIGIQFYRPHKSEYKPETLDDFLLAEKAPNDVKALIRNSCYDCHSNQTNYLWYDHIAPASWYVDNHIKEAKEELNFSEWATMDYRSKRSTLSLIATEITENKMPLESYTMMHGDAKLSQEDKDKILKWLFTIEVTN